MKKIKTFIKVFVFAVLTLMITVGVAGFLKDKNNYAKYNEFYKETESFDILFFGSSRMLDAVHPMQLWTYYGLTSYNMSQHSENLGITYWQMRNAFEYNVPKVAVVDISLYFTKKVEDNDGEAKSYLHKSMDHWKLSKLKYDALEELLDDDVDKMEYLFPFSMYHYRWNQLESQDVHIPSITQKGAESKMDVLDWSDECVWLSDSTIEGFAENKGNIEQFERIIRLCDEYDVELIFTYVPSISGCWDEGVCKVINSYEEWLSERQIRFLNLARDMKNINYGTDFNDVSHVNCSGAKKITDWLGNYLITNYRFVDKSEKTIKAWNEDKEGWMQMKKNQFAQAERNQDIVQYLMLMNDASYSFIINIPDINEVDLARMQPMFDELGLRKYSESTSRYMYVKDGVAQEDIEACDVDELDCTISAGDIYFSCDETGVYYYYCGIHNFVEREDYKMQIFVFENTRNELIDQATFN